MAYKMRKKDITRFWDNVVQHGTCLEWTKSLDGRGYGKFVTWENGKHKYHIASRVAWQLENGPIKPFVQVCHKCDNAKCVNPDHLFIGTKSDNMKDMVRKGRNDYRVGENNPKAKLTKKQVNDIRFLRKHGTSASAIGSAFGIATNTVYNICNPNQKCWTGRRSMKGV